MLYKKFIYLEITCSVYTANRVLFKNRTDRTRTRVVGDVKTVEDESLRRYRWQHLPHQSSLKGIGEESSVVRV